MKSLSPEQALAFLKRGGKEPIRVSGRLDLHESGLKQLPAGLHCYELDVRGLPLRELPADLKVDCRLTADNCVNLRTLPENFTTGSLSLRGARCLETLPEGLDVWYLDLTDCPQFSRWPERGRIHRGRLNLRNCIDVTHLPPWLTLLAQLDVAGCPRLRELPSTLRVTGWIDVGGSGLERLPAQLAEAPLRWRGVPVDERTAFRPQEITSAEALKQRNAELRRVMIERMGYVRFAAEAGAKVLNEDTDPGGRRQLLRIELDDDEPLVGLTCNCPSTGRQYFLRVPPTTKTCHQAAAWIAGFDDPKKYHPVRET